MSTEVTTTKTKRVRATKEQKQALDALIAKHGAKIAGAWNTHVTSILETGRLLIEAKAEIPHGDWERLFRDGLFPHHPVPFGTRTAQMLMAIAKDPVLTNPKFASYLPPSWATLHDMVGLPEDEFEQYIDLQMIHPEMTRANVNQLPRKRLALLPTAIVTLSDLCQQYDPEDIAEYLIHNVNSELWEHINFQGLVKIEKASKWLLKLHDIYAELSSDPRDAPAVKWRKEREAEAKAKKPRKAKTNGDARELHQ